MIDQKLQDRLDAYLVMWQQSPASSRIDQVEGFSINHGFEEYSGQTIPEFIIFVLNDLLLFLAEQPELLETVRPAMTDQDAAARFLQAEQEKIDTAASLVKKMHSYWFGPFDPRYYKTLKEYNRVIDTFGLINEDGQFMLPNISDLPR